jgi:hypothetical protein
VGGHALRALACDGTPIRAENFGRELEPAPRDSTEDFHSPGIFAVSWTPGRQALALHGIAARLRLECGGLPPLSRGHRARASEGSAKNPPRGKFVRGVSYVAAKAATHKASEYVAASLRGLRQEAATHKAIREKEGAASSVLTESWYSNTRLRWPTEKNQKSRPLRKGLWVNSYGIHETSPALPFAKRLWVNSFGIHEKAGRGPVHSGWVCCGGHSMLCPYGISVRQCAPEIIPRGN